jgi:hypothetical protein
MTEQLTQFPSTITLKSHLTTAVVGLPENHDEFNRHFENTFGLLVSNACPPYETEHIDSKFTFQQSHALADSSGFYRAFGVTPSESHPERPDHIVQELEFMACLIGRGRRRDDVLCWGQAIHLRRRSLAENQRMQSAKSTCMNRPFASQSYRVENNSHGDLAFSSDKPERGGTQTLQPLRYSRRRN